MFAKIVVVLASLLSVTAFMAPVSRSSVRSLSMLNEDRSVALPFDKRPANLDGTLVGDFGFDPAGFSNNPPQFFGGNIKWYREAEIMHGRIAQLAVLGSFVPNWIHFAGNADVGLDAYAEVNPLKALSTVPEAALWQIAIFIYGLELFRIKNIILGDKEPGDHGLGQGAWNPFNFKYTPEEYAEKQLQEIKHGRLAMFGSIGILLQNSISGQGVLQQLGGAFTFPDERAILAGPGTLGDYFPPNL